MASQMTLKKVLNNIQKEIPEAVSADYIFGVTFYKFLCEKINYHLDNELSISNLTFAEAYKNDLFKETLKNSAIKNLGYFIEPKYLFENILVRLKTQQQVKEVKMHSKAFLNSWTWIHHS